MFTLDCCKYCINLINLIQYNNYTNIDVILLNIGYHYKNIHHKYELMVKYYLMAIDKGNSDAMYNLGIYYNDINYNFDYEVTQDEIKIFLLEKLEG